MAATFIAGTAELVLFLFMLQPVAIALTSIAAARNFNVDFTVRASLLNGFVVSNPAQAGYSFIGRAGRGLEQFRRRFARRGVHYDSGDLMITPWLTLAAVMLITLVLLCTA